MGCWPRLRSTGQHAYLLAGQHAGKRRKPLRDDNRTATVGVGSKRLKRGRTGSGWEFERAGEGTPGHKKTDFGESALLLSAGRRRTGMQSVWSGNLHTESSRAFRQQVSAGGTGVPVAWLSGARDGILGSTGK